MAVELPRVGEALVLSALDYPLAELSRKSIVLSLCTVVAKKNREGGGVPGGKVPISPLYPRPGQAPLTCLCSREMTPRSHTGVTRPWRQQAVMNGVHSSVICTGCPTPPSRPAWPHRMQSITLTTASDTAICHLMLRPTQTDGHWQRQMVRVGRRARDRWMDVWPEWLALC